ncbi:SA1362 family protein [Bacillus sp. 2205SS5-2]|uniref:SA1362 family protein n=1 Tax=Bacillus sp. 2205SS5-2 TaxID=3109031 RepID=UPI00300539F1
MRFRSLLILSVIALAIFGFLFSLLNDPMSIVRYGFYLVLSAGIIFIVYRFIMKRRLGSGGFKQQKAYLNAAKQSRKRLKSKSTKPTKSATRQRPLRKRSDVKLTVIEGKKNKKKNRASL